MKVREQPRMLSPPCVFVHVVKSFVFTTNNTALLNKVGLPPTTVDIRIHRVSEFPSSVNQDDSEWNLDWLILRNRVRWVTKKTKSVLDTADLSRPSVSICGLTYRHRLLFEHHFTMDPRRARDPRLARADPRLQGRSHSNSPAPQSYHGAMLQPNVTHGGPSHAASTSYLNQQVTHQAPATPDPPVQSTVTQSSPQPQGQSNKPYKARPLFCVVCASNQVCFSTRSLKTLIDVIIRIIESFDGGT